MSEFKINDRVRSEYHGNGTIISELGNSPMCVVKFDRMPVGSATFLPANQLTKLDAFALAVKADDTLYLGGDTSFSGTAIGVVTRSPSAASAQRSPLPRIGDFIRLTTESFVHEFRLLNVHRFDMQYSECRVTNFEWVNEAGHRCQMVVPDANNAWSILRRPLREGDEFYDSLDEQKTISQILGPGTVQCPGATVLFPTRGRFSGVIVRRNGRPWIHANGIAVDMAQTVQESQPGEAAPPALRVLHVGDAVKVADDDPVHGTVARLAVDANLADVARAIAGPDATKQITITTADLAEAIFRSHRVLGRHVLSCAEPDMNPEDVAAYRARVERAYDVARESDRDWVWSGAVAQAEEIVAKMR